MAPSMQNIVLNIALPPVINSQPKCLELTNSKLSYLLVIPVIVPYVHSSWNCWTGELVTKLQCLQCNVCSCTKSLTCQQSSSSWHESFSSDRSSLLLAASQCNDAWAVFATAVNMLIIFCQHCANQGWPSGIISCWPSGRLHIRRFTAAYACQQPLPMMGPPPRGLNRLLIRRLIGENIQSSPARPAGATPSYGGMVGPWSTNPSLGWLALG